jgi:hypothetical protein
MSCQKIGNSAPSSPKIDDQATEGLLGTPNSLSYRVHEIEKHLHSIERWFGSDGDGTGSTANNMTDWQLTAGTGGAFGTEVQLLGANDVAVGDFGFTPVKFDLHRLFVTAASATDDYYIIQIWTGTTTFGAATLHTEVPYMKGSNFGEVVPVECQMARVAVAEKVWARVKSETNGATIDLTIGIHAYVG